MARRHSMTVQQRALLAQDLAETRSKVEGIVDLMRTCFGEDADAFVRAQEVGAALQRLEWALERQSPTEQLSHQKQVPSDGENVEAGIDSGSGEAAAQE